MLMNKEIINILKAEAIALKDLSSDYDSLINFIGDAQIVLLGEASHGTQEFYDARAKITQRLIEEKNFNAVAIEGDWPDTYQINKYINGLEYKKATDALAAFDRFPTWMWKNTSVLNFIEWLKVYNTKQAKTESKIGFYGLDVYSLYRSIDSILQYLDKINAQAAAEARYYYSCLNKYREDPQMYGYEVFAKIIKSCEYEVLEELKRLQSQNFDWIIKDKISTEDAFYSEQNAQVIKNAENYYRALFIKEENTWNIRDSHMFDTLNMLINYYNLKKNIDTPKIIIWAHNSHIGNSKATEMNLRGEYNIGELVKEKFGSNAISIGFTTYNGTVSAASDWHAPVERKILRNALPESYEYIFHATEIEKFFLILKNNKIKNILPKKLLERAIGVIYRPETERQSHYFYTDLAEQFDVIIHFDKTRALEPLEKTSRWLTGETPETYPSGL